MMHCLDLIGLLVEKLQCLKIQYRHLCLLLSILFDVEILHISRELKFLHIDVPQVNRQVDEEVSY